MCSVIGSHEEFKRKSSEIAIASFSVDPAPLAFEVNQSVIVR